MTKSKNLFKNISIIFCLVPMLILSLFCLIPNNNNHSVSAVDYLVDDFTFVGSNFLTCTTSLSGSGSFDRYCFATISLTFSRVNGLYSFSVTGGINHQTLDSSSAYSRPLSLTTVSNISPSYYQSNIIDLKLTQAHNTNYYIYSSYIFYGNLSSEINRVRFYSAYDGITGTTLKNHVRYYDKYDNYFDFCIWTYPMSSPTTTSLAEFFRFIDRTYYVNLDFTNNTYYENGYTDGYNVGIVDGNETGYQEGYSAGNTIGYQNGYSAGLASSDNNNFMSLIGAVIDVPVSAFTSLLNFELLGVNLLGFICGLLTLALIVFIVKLFIGGK